MFKEKV
jgi:hypothetical protein